MKFIVIAILLCMLITFHSVAEKTDFDERYLRLDIESICTPSSQLKISFVNVSGQKLQIEPHYVLPSLFDIVQQGAYLNDIDTDTRLRLRTRAEYQEQNFWSVLTAGERAEHLINYREFVAIDTDKEYQAGISARIPILLENGTKKIVRLSSSILQKYQVITPECWK